MAHFG